MIDLLHLGDLYVSDFLAADEEPRSDPWPLRLVMDDDGIVHLAEQPPAELMWGRYWYRSGTNATMRAELYDIVKQIGGLVHLDAGDLWVDIASNDGTLLSFVDKAVFRMGVDPVEGDIQAEAIRHADAIVIEPFTSSLVRRLLSELDGERAKVITCIAMFYDLMDPTDFLAGVKDLLADDGVFVLQMSYTPLMLEQLAFDNICLPPEDPVITEQGLVPIGEIGRGHRVLTHTGEYHAVEDFIRRPFDGTIVELTAYGFGHTLRVTPGHPVLTPNGFVKASDLQVGDVVGRAVPKPTAAPPYEFTPELAEIAGYYLAEGTVGVHGTAVAFCFGINEAEEELADRCQELILGLGLTASQHQVRTGNVVQVYGWLAPFLINNFGKGAEGKRIPAWDMTPAAAERLLTAYMAGDGYRYRGHYLRSSTVSQQLAVDLQMLANRVGYHASINRQERPETCVIEGRVVNQKPLWDVLVHTDPQNRHKCWLADGVQWGRIRRVAQTRYVGDVVNLEVEGDHTYSTPAMTVHNCHEHARYYTLTTLRHGLFEAGLRVVDVELNDTNGGSFRVVVQHQHAKPLRSQPWRDVAEMRVVSLIANEFRCGYNEPLVWDRFRDRLETLRQQVRQFVREVGPVYAYGASTKGNTLLQYFGLDHTMIDGIAERQEAKWGLRTVGTNIPIVSEDEWRAACPEYTLMLPWHFVDAFVEREAKYLDAGRFVVPCPRFDVIGAELRLSA